MLKHYRAGLTKKRGYTRSVRATAHLLLASLTLWALPTRAGTTPEVKVDRRVQVVTTVYWLATEGKAFEGRVDKAYADRTKFYFHKLHAHPAFKYAKKLNDAGFTADQAIPWILSYSSLPELDPPPPRQGPPWGKVTEDDLNAFADALRDFASDTNFDAFLEQQSLRLIGQATRARQALEPVRDWPEHTQILVTPLVGTRTWTVTTEAETYIIVNPSGFESIGDLTGHLRELLAP